MPFFLSSYFLIILLVSKSVFCTECTCVIFYLCNNDTINTNGWGILSARMGVNECSNALYVCCNNDEIVAKSTTEPPPPPSPSINLHCGKRNNNGIGSRISGDNEAAEFGEFPWMIAVLKRKNNGRKYFYKCGGSLIHSKVVLTAAHCVTGAVESYKIRAGEWDSSSTQEIYKHENRNIASIIIHPNYNCLNLNNDIALLILEKSLQLNHYINVVCMPLQNSVIKNEWCVVSGWGKTVFGQKDSYETILKKIELPLVERSQCELNFRKTRLGEKFNLHESFICAGGEDGRDSCTGDGGSPLVCPIIEEGNIKYQQVGIVTWGIGCGTKDVPGAYVNVALFYNWIHEELKKKHIILRENSFAQ